MLGNNYPPEVRREGGSSSPQPRHSPSSLHLEQHQSSPRPQRHGSLEQELWASGPNATQQAFSPAWGLFPDIPPSWESRTMTSVPLCDRGLRGQARGFSVRRGSLAGFPGALPERSQGSEPSWTLSSHTHRTSSLSLVQNWRKQEKERCSGGEWRI